MKKQLISLVVFNLTSFFLAGLQSNLYFLPISLPAFWFIILSYYSFNKSLLFSLCCNFVHSLILISFSSISMSFLLVSMNLFTLAFIIVRERFHTSNIHIAIASGGGYFIFLTVTWAFQCLNQGLFFPDILAWIGSSLLTTLFAPIIIFVLQLVDEKIHFERVDTLENLRI